MINQKHHRYIFNWAAFITGCFFFWSCENDQKLIDEWTKDKVMVEEAIDVKTYISQGSRMKALLKAPLMLRYQSDTNHIEFPRTLHVDFFDISGKVESQLSCKHGVYYETLNKILLRDSVVIFNVSGDTLRTPELWWDQNKQTFFTNKNVAIRKSGNLIYGVGMEARQDLTEIRIAKVTGTVWVPDSMASPHPAVDTTRKMNAPVPGN